MVTKSANILAFLVLVCIVAGVAYIAYPLYIGGAGFTVNAITSDRTISNDADIALANFIISATLDGSGGKIVGYLTQDEFNNRLQNVKVTYPIEITTDSVNERAVYVIQNDYTQIKSYSYTREWICPSNTLAIGVFGSPVRRYVCLKTEVVGTKGSFNRVNTYFDVNVAMQSHGETISGQLRTYPLEQGGMQTTVDLYDSSGKWRGQARWVGNLQTGTGIPEPANYIVTTSSTSPVWKVRTRAEWEDYRFKFESNTNRLYDCDASATCTETYIEQLISEATAYSSAILNEPSVQILGTGEQQIRTADNKDAIQVNLRENNLIYSYPSVTFLVSAYWLGAYIPVGMPDIVSTSDVSIFSGESGVLSVTVKNIGDVDASFDAAIISPCRVVQEGVARITIPKGGTGTTSIPVSVGSANVAESGSCQVKVYATTKSSNYDTSYFNYQVKKARECAPSGAYKGENNCISRCSNEGYWELVTCCEGDKHLTYDASDTQYGGWKCVAGGGGDGNGESTCYEQCVTTKQCTSWNFFCLFSCQAYCWFISNIIWFMLIGGLLILSVVVFIVLKLRRLFK